jgi:hypothetical protein
MQLGRPIHPARRLPLIPAVLLIVALVSTSMSETARGSGLQQGPALGCTATSNFFFTTLTTLQETPIPGPNGPPANQTIPTTLTGNGFSTALLDPTQTQLRVTLSYQGLSSGPRRFHVHQIVPPTPPNATVPPPNVTGGIIVPFVEPASPTDIPNPLLLPPPPIILNLNPLAPSTLNALQTLRTQNGSYFNVHTLTNPGGEIRGATICTTLAPGTATPPCIPGQVLPFATGQATGSITCNNPFTYTVTPNTIPADAPVGSRPVVIIPIIRAGGQATFDTFNCDQVISAARTVTCSGTGPPGDTVALGSSVLLAFQGASSTQPTGTLQPLAFAATTVNPGLNPPGTTGQANTPCAGAVGQVCTVAGGVAGPWTKRASGSFALTATGPAGTLPLSFPTVFLPTTIGVEAIQCNQLGVAAPFVATCVGNTAGDLLQGATVTVRFVLAAGGTADITGVVTGPGVAPAPIVPAPAPAARQPVIIGPLLPPPPPIPPPPPFPPLPPPAMAPMGGQGMPMMQPPARATATPTADTESRRGAPASNMAQSPNPASDSMPLGAPPPRPATADVAAPAPPTSAETTPATPGGAMLAPDPASLMPSAAPSASDGPPEPSSALPIEPGALDAIEPLGEQP